MSENPAVRLQDPAPSPQAGRRFLLVDDYPDTVESLAALLRLLGHEVATAWDGPSALVFAAALKPDVVLLDLDLPGMSGYELARRLRKMPELEGALLVAASDFALKADRHRALEAGCNAHLAKPTGSGELLAVIERARPSAQRHTPATRARGGAISGPPGE